MLETFLLPIEEAALIFFFVAILLLLPICVIHYRRFGYLRPTRAVVFYSFLFYALCAMALVILPLPKITSQFCEVHTLARQMQVIPFKFVQDIIGANKISLRHFNLISILESFAFLQAFFNFLLLMPLGIYLHYYLRVSIKITAIIAIATTLFFEITQLTGIYGLYPCPYRVFDVDDLILNSSGVMVGYAIAPLLVFLPNLQQQPRPIPNSVSIPRRLFAFIIDWFIANTIAQFIFNFIFSKAPENQNIWISLFVYFCWFIAIPLFWHGQTIGKQLVKIHLTSRSGKSVRFSKLCIRYGLLIFIPVVIETGFNSLFKRQQETLGYTDGISALIFLIILALEFILLFGFAIIRQDHQGIHEIISRTQNSIKTESTNRLYKNRVWLLAYSV